MDEYLWPARNVAEYAYCPRLFYLMEVEGVYLPNEETEAGKAVHKRVDRPSSDTEDEVRPKSVRSLTLTSGRLKLTATLDLAEIDGNHAIPVEYRKGRPKKTVMAPPPDDPGESDEPPLASTEPWPTDRVQIGLQVILLEEAGYAVPEAFLYYAAEKLKLAVPVDEALKKDALATLEAAQVCARGSRPLPLVNDRRCEGCSLQPLCLPDEVNYERAGDPGSMPSPRKLWPPRSDGIHLVAQQKGTRIGVRGTSVRITDDRGSVVKEIPLVNMESLSVLGSVQISTQALQVFADREIPVAYLSPAGRLVALVEPATSTSGHIRRAQFKALDAETVKLELARALITAKILNQRKLLQRNHAALPDGALDNLTREAEAAARAESTDSLRGHEGRAAAIYFGLFSGMIRPEAGREFQANGRQRRPPPDPVNCALSLAYSMLTHEATAALRTASLETSIGAFHVSRPGRPALSLDLMEPFRPLIADSCVIAGFNRGEFRDGHFARTAAGCMFTDHGRRAFFNTYGRRMDDEVTHPEFGYRLSYRRMIVLHARMIAAWFMGEVPRLSFLTTR
ncbi:MAG: CRISPR-associated endonuclease Cas1 [Deltaproteobacteria bacterium]|nr:CRISPR-associated endonuclease Cas1 [Deltaproteobacteria bacterium]